MHATRRSPLLRFLVALGVCLATGTSRAHDADNVSLIGRWAEGPCHAVASVGLTAYFANGAVLEIVRYEPAGDPVPLGRLELPGPPRGIAVVGDVAYVACGWDGLRLIDVADPTAPVEVGYRDTGDLAQIVFVDGGRIYVADGDDGLYVLQDDLLTAAPDDDTPIAAARRLSVHPNPFNPRTSVVFALARPQRVRLAVYDLCGRQVARLAERTFAAGRHDVSWDGTDASGRAVATGAYLVRLEGEDWSEARKVALVR